MWLRLREEVLVSCPAQKVWAQCFAGFVQAWPRISTTLTSLSRLDDAPIGVGTIVLATGANPRGKVSFRMEVVQFDPPRVFAVRGPNGATERYELDETPDGTVVRAITGTPLDWRGVLNYWTLRAWSRKHARSDLQRLKTEAEGS